MTAALRRRVAALEGRRSAVPKACAADYFEIMAEIADELAGRRPPSPPLPARDPIARLLVAWRPDDSLDGKPPALKRRRRAPRKGALAARAARKSAARTGEA